MPTKPAGRRTSMPTPPEPGVGPIGDGPFLIDYRPSPGKRTLRWITVTGAISSGATGTVSAYCHLRGESRTFRQDRIASATTPDGDLYESKPGRGAMRQVLDEFRTRGPAERAYD